MDIVVHPISGASPPHDDAWVDAVLATVQGSAGALVSRAMGMPSRETGVPGLLITIWDGDGAGSTAAVEVGAGLRIGAGRRYRITAGGSGLEVAGPPRYVQFTEFAGPHDQSWVDAFTDSGRRRIWPAMRPVPGIVACLTAVAADGAALALPLAESVESLEEALRRTMAASLLPDEDPALLTGPDHVDTHRLLHAEIPAGLLGPTG
ncbi:hypothetical protein MXD59_13230 [Frankia sp. Ag45/Mut15]|uniref:Uncharacterized protein n=1 Tax=Frankia umida TaxID=573489 RepID=A0ABT0JZL0_9ACTN|nr:hypothetical protein [Frankia umida]MCK9876729.1 hypothetical protein [Frankia umida]